MREKHYKQERRYLKEAKRAHKNFNSVGERKNFIEGIKREYRSLKRSEKQVIKKQMIDKVWGVDDDQYDPQEDQMLDE